MLGELTVGISGLIRAKFGVLGAGGIDTMLSKGIPHGFFASK